MKKRKTATIMITIKATISLIIILCLSFLLPAPVFAQHGDHSGTNPHGGHNAHGEEGIGRHSGHGKVLQLDNIIVTGEKISEYIANHPQRVSVLGRKEIVEGNFLGMEAALSSIPGVDVRQSGNNLGTRISIRGSSGSGGVVVLINGRPMNSSQYSTVDVGSIPIEMVKRVTVFKPPVPVWLGPGGTAGVINIETQSSGAQNLTLMEGEKRPKKGKIKIHGGSFGNVEANYSLIIPKERGSVMISAGGGHRDGSRPNSDWDKGLLNIHWDRKSLGMHKYEVNTRYYFTERGSPGRLDNLTPDARQRYSKGAFDFSFKGFRGDIQDISLKTYFDMENLKDTSQTGKISNLDMYKFGLKSESCWTDIIGKWSVRAGAFAEEDEVNHTLSGKHHRETISLHTQLDKEFQPISAALGVRGDYTNDFHFSPAITSGLSYEIGKNILFQTNIGYSEKVPTFSQLYQPSHGSIDQVQGNPDLVPEKHADYDLGMVYSSSRNVSFEVTGFWKNTQDKIVHQRGDDLVYRPINIERGVRRGMETSLKIKPAKGASLEISLIYQRGENKENEQELTNTPRYKGKINGQYLFQSKTRAEATLRAVSSQFSDIENSKEGELDDYTTVDLKLIHPIAIGSTRSEVFIKINNLFDEYFEFHHGYPDDGFRFVCGLNVNY